MERKQYLPGIAAALLIIGIASEGFGQQKQPQYGGTLRIVRVEGPRVLSYLPEMGPLDESAVFPAVERLMEYLNEKDTRVLVPFLAESVTVAKDGKSITFKLRKGIKFHDGSELNADAVAWNYQLYKDTKRLQYDSKVTKIETVDDYTVTLHVTQYNNQLLHGLGWVPIYSKKAWDAAGGGNAEKSKEWARGNVVGTGPFKFVEYKRDNYIKWAKNEDYWQKGKPYLDGILTRFIPDPVTASALMQSKEADLWIDAPIKDQLDLEKKGLVRNSVSYVGWVWGLIPNTKDTGSPWQDKRVREALEYALDKPVIAKAMGFGYFTPLSMVPPPGEWGYDPEYKGRPYDPAKAKRLLAEAGFPNGLKAKILVMSGPNVAAATALKRYLDDAGFELEVDAADPGRFFGSLWRQGWKDLAWFNTGIGINYLVAFHRYWSHEPMANFSSFGRPQDLVKMSEESLKYDKEADQKAATKRIMRYISDEALVAPVYFAPNAYMTQPWVHTDYLQQSLNRWRLFDAWMEKH